MRGGGEDSPAPCFDLAGFPVALDIADAALRASFERAFAAFRCEAPPTARVDVRPSVVPRPAPAVRHHPEAHLDEDGGVRLEDVDYEARVSEDGLRASVTGSGSFPVETVLKVMLAGELARRGGLLVHGVAVEHAGRAALLVGHSGAGKSTLGGLWRASGGTVLADELVAVWPGADGWRAAGTPWNTGLPREAPLRAVGTLAWDAQARWEPQPAGEVARVLLLNALLPVSSAEGRAGLMAFAARLLSEVETARLVFPRDTSVALVLRERLEAR
ncbi:hypothetical protein P2318_16900 [Myxococcaceae bacterium GXIMD 01537]